MTPAGRGRVLVTGATGFIGARLVGLLAAAGTDVLPWRRDIGELAACDEPAAAVVHLAALTRPDQFAGDRERAYAVNVGGTAAALDYCERTGAGLVLASTCGVYAPADAARPLDESAPLGPRSDYASSKLRAETLCRERCREKGLSCVALRLFNVYGPGQSGAFVIPQIVAGLLAARPSPLLHPRTVLDFVDVTDAAEAFRRARAVLGPPGCRVYNIGSGQGTCLAEVERVARELVTGSPCAAADAGPEDPGSACVVADAGKARAELGWTATVSLRRGLDAVVRSLGRDAAGRNPQRQDFVGGKAT